MVGLVKKLTNPWKLLSIGWESFCQAFSDKNFPIIHKFEGYIYKKCETIFEVHFLTIFAKSCCSHEK